MNKQKAFPVITGSGENPNTNEKYFYANEGMDLRDYFAAKAMQSIMLKRGGGLLLDEDMEESSEGLYVKSERDNSYYIPSFTFSEKTKYKIVSSYEERMVREAYRIADAMLKEREKK